MIGPHALSKNGEQHKSAFIRFVMYYPVYVSPNIRPILDSEGELSITASEPSMWCLLRCDRLSDRI
jgi:hypothetical protein